MAKLRNRDAARLLRKINKKLPQILALLSKNQPRVSEPRFSGESLSREELLPMPDYLFSIHFYDYLVKREFGLTTTLSMLTRNLLSFP